MVRCTRPPHCMIDTRLLVGAVLAQAWRDVQHGRHQSVRRAAELWLLTPDNQDRQFWTAAAGVED